jgi:hypothetical protein
MKIKYHLDTQDLPKMVGRQSFNYFIELIEKTCDYFVDDLSLATINNRYKIFTGKVKEDKKSQILENLDEYSSLDICKHWLNKTPVNYNYTFYFSPYYKNNKWLMDYGVVIDTNLYVCGRFNLNSSVINSLINSKLLAEFNLQFTKTDLRTHFMLNKIKSDMYFLDLGPCKKNYPTVYNNTVSVIFYDLGQWIFDMGINTWAVGQSEKYSKLFQEWSKTKTWGSMIKLSVSVGKDGVTEFKVTPKWC